MKNSNVKKKIKIKGVVQLNFDARIRWVIWSLSTGHVTLGCGVRSRRDIAAIIFFFLPHNSSPLFGGGSAALPHSKSIPNFRSYNLSAPSIPFWVSPPSFGFYISQITGHTSLEHTSLKFEKWNSLPWIFGIFPNAIKGFISPPPQSNNTI